MPTSSPNASLSGTLVAKIVVLSILILIAAIAGLFFLHRRRKRSKQRTHSTTAKTPSEVSNYAEVSEKESNDRLELVGNQQRRIEIARNSKRVTNVYEMYHPAVELEAAHLATPGKREQLNTKQDWI